MKKLLIFIAIFVMSISSTNAFLDSEVNAANTLAERWIINDNSWTVSEYNLDQNVLRQEIAAVSRGIGNISKTTDCKEAFSDIDSENPNDWACYTVEALLSADLIASNEEFRPEENITKAEWLGMIVKAACGDSYAYDDSKVWLWQEQVVAYASDANLVESFTDYDTFATRGWVFEVWFNAMEVCNTEAILDSIDIMIMDLIEDDYNDEWDTEILNINTETEMAKYEGPTIVNGDVVATIKTNNGTIKLKLFTELVPKTTANFIGHSKNGYYDWVVFHRIIPDFMIQWGDPEGTGRGWESIYWSEFDDEFHPDLKNIRGTISMANAGPNTNGSQFFINVVDNNFLDNRHAVFWQVVEGMDIADKISKAKTWAGDEPVSEIKMISSVVEQYQDGKYIEYDFDINEFVD